MPPGVETLGPEETAVVRRLYDYCRFWRERASWPLLYPLLSKQSQATVTQTQLLDYLRTLDYGLVRLVSEGEFHFGEKEAIAQPILLCRDDTGKSFLTTRVFRFVKEEQRWGLRWPPE